MVGGGGEGRAGESLPWWRILGWRVEERPLPASPASVCPLPPWDPSSQHLPLYPRHPSVPPYSFPSSSSGPPSLLNSPPTPAGSLLPCSHPLSPTSPLPSSAFPSSSHLPSPAAALSAACPAKPPLPGQRLGACPLELSPGAIPPALGTRERSRAPPPAGGRGVGWGRGRPRDWVPLAARPPSQPPALRRLSLDATPAMSWAVVFGLLAALLLLLLLTRRRTR